MEIKLAVTFMLLIGTTKVLCTDTEVLCSGKFTEFTTVILNISVYTFNTSNCYSNEILLGFTVPWRSFMMPF